MDEDIEFLPLIPIEENTSSEDDIIPDELPLLPLRNSVLFPGVVIPITVGRDKSVRAIKAANKKIKYIGVIAQNDPEIEEPELSDLHQIGTVARIIKSLKLPDGSNTVIIQGKKRFNTKSVLKEEPYFLAEIDLIEEEKVNKNPKMLALMDSIKDFAFKIIEISPNIQYQTSIDSLFKENAKISKFSPKKASYLSMGLPGLGQFYSGDLKNGFSSLGLNAVLLSAFLITVSSSGVLNAVLIIYPWYQRYFIGGFQAARRNAIIIKQERRADIYQVFLKKVESLRTIPLK